MNYLYKITHLMILLKSFYLLNIITILSIFAFIKKNEYHIFLICVLFIVEIFNIRNELIDFLVIINVLLLIYFYILDSLLAFSNLIVSCGNIRRLSTYHHSLIYLNIGVFTTVYFYFINGFI